MMFCFCIWNNFLCTSWPGSPSNNNFDSLYLLRSTRSKIYNAPYINYSTPFQTGFAVWGCGRCRKRYSSWSCWHGSVDSGGTLMKCLQQVSITRLHPFASTALQTSNKNQWFGISWRHLNCRPTLAPGSLGQHCWSVHILWCYDVLVQKTLINVNTRHWVTSPVALRYDVKSVSKYDSKSDKRPDTLQSDWHVS